MTLNVRLYVCMYGCMVFVCCFRCHEIVMCSVNVPVVNKFHREKPEKNKTSTELQRKSNKTNITALYIVHDSNALQYHVQTFENFQKFENTENIIFLLPLLFHCFGNSAFNLWFVSLMLFFLSFLNFPMDRSTY